MRKKLNNSMNLSMSNTMYYFAIRNFFNGNERFLSVSLKLSLVLGNYIIYMSF